jgi:hypothetical protein
MDEGRRLSHGRPNRDGDTPFPSRRVAARADVAARPDAGCNPAKEAGPPDRLARQLETWPLTDARQKRRVIELIEPHGL